MSAIPQKAVSGPEEPVKRETRKRLALKYTEPEDSEDELGQSGSIEPTPKGRPATKRARATPKTKTVKLSSLVTGEDAVGPSEELEQAVPASESKKTTNPKQKSTQAKTKTPATKPKTPARKLVKPTTPEGDPPHRQASLEKKDEDEPVAPNDEENIQGNTITEGAGEVSESVPNDEQEKVSPLKTNGAESEPVTMEEDNKATDTGPKGGQEEVVTPKVNGNQVELSTAEQNGDLLNVTSNETPTSKSISRPPKQDSVPPTTPTEAVHTLPAEQPTITTRSGRKVKPMKEFNSTEPAQQSKQTPASKARSRPKPTVKQSPVTTTPRGEAAKIKKYELPSVVTSAKSPLIKGNILSILQNPIAWTSLTEAERVELGTFLPANYHSQIGSPSTNGTNEDVASSTLAIDVPGLILNSSKFKTDVRLFQDDLRDGKLEMEWIEGAMNSSARRAAGEFDAWIDEKIRTIWSIEDTPPPSNGGQALPENNGDEMEV